MCQRLVILTDGYSNPITAKTATGVIRYGRDEVVAILDTTQAGKTCQEVLGIGGSIPVVGSLDLAPPADVLLIGIAPSGGRVPERWRPLLLDAIRRGMGVVSGLHDFLTDDDELAAAARQHGAQLLDIRKNNEHDVANREGLRHECLRIQTVGQDCCVGKKVVAIEVARGLEKRGVDAKFIATGQTGIMIEGDGCPIDTVVSDFLSGAVEKLVLKHQHREVLMFEGQGSLAHPRYSAVTLGLLHGALPQGLIMCYEAGRQNVHGMEQIPLVPLPKLIEAYETMAALMQPARVIGLAMNGRLLGEEQAAAERERVRTEIGLPVCDVFRDGPTELVDAVLKLKSEVIPAR